MGFIHLQYAESDNTDCPECEDPIEAGNLEVECYFKKREKYHFQCLIDSCSFDGCQKRDIQIALEKDPDKPSAQMLKYVSMEAYDQELGNYKLGITRTDLAKIREQISLAKEHKTAYYIPAASRTRYLIECPKLYCLRNSSDKADVDEEELCLDFQEHDYHPKCLAKSGQVNVDADEITDYSTLPDSDKKLLNKYFKKNSRLYNHPKLETTSVGDEFCSYSKCTDLHDSITTTPIKGYRIRYQTKVYHTKCFAEMWIVNIDGEEIGNYDTLSEHWKANLDNLFEKWNNFDIPIIETAFTCKYCNADQCLLYDHPSKFPYPYTIKKDELQIKFHGEYYHPRCFKVSGKSDVNVKDFANYSDLTDRDDLDERFMQNGVVVDRNGNNNRRNRVADNDVMDDYDDGDTDEPPTKMPRLTAETQNDNTSTTNQMEDEENAMGNSLDDIPPNIKEEVIEHRVIHLAFPSSVSETSSNDQNQSNDVITVNSEEPSSSTRNENVETQEYDSDCVIIDDEGPPSTSQRHDNPVSGSIVGSGAVIVDNQMDDNGDPVILEPPVKNKKLEPKIEVEITSAATETPPHVNEETPILDSAEIQMSSYDFAVPNYAFIKSTLHKLQFPINRQALSFWAKVAYDVIPSTSTPASTLSISSADDSFFKCISCFFTGDESTFDCIKAGIQSYFRASFKTFGTIDGVDYSKLYVTSKEVKDLYECRELTNVHFNIICSWLKCRIGIFSAGRGLQKYGNWNESSHPILLLENENGFYKPILTLS